jgi:alpha-L-rhamnosidase
MLTIKELRCEYHTDPLAIEEANPLFSWSFNSVEEEVSQDAFKLIVSSNLHSIESNEGDMWDSGIFQSKTNNIRYKGLPLEAGKSYWWKIRVHSDNGVWSDWKQAIFGMALERNQWQASWICPARIEPNNLPDIPEPSPLLRRTFTLLEPVKQARLYICGLGYYRVYINGKPIGDFALAPEVSQYDKTTYYDCYDVSDCLGTDNVIAVELGNGWYNCFTHDVWGFQNAPWRHFPKLLCQLDIQDEKNKHYYITSDKNWKFHEGPILFDGLRNGETYDARKEILNWNHVKFDDNDWSYVMITRPPGGILRASQIPQIKVRESIVPQTCRKIGVNWVFDIGKTISGYVYLALNNTKSGQTITIRYGEKLDALGAVDTSDIDYLIKSGDFQTDRYITRGGDSEHWSPRFTYHGFRYIEISGYDNEMDISNVKGIFIHTDITTRGLFITKNPLINAVHEMCARSLLINYHSIPTDCPHREKNGWTGDAHLSSDQGLFNFDTVTAYRKFVCDIIDCQRPNGAIPGIIPVPGWGYNWGSGPAWDSALPILAWNLYIFDGDLKILKEAYNPICKYMELLHWMEIEPGIVDFGLGDWCAPGRTFNGPKCPSIITDTAYYFCDAKIASRIARLLNLPDDAIKWEQKAGQIKEAFLNHFVDLKTGIMVSDSQTAYSCAIYQGLTDGEVTQKVGQRLIEQVKQAEYHIDTGILGTKYLFAALSSIGETEIAFRIVSNPTYPGWAYEVEHGATSIWEHWDGQKSQMHHMFSDIDAWFYRSLAGLSPDEENPGFKHTWFRPALLKVLGAVQCEHESQFGTIAISWEYQGDQVKIDISIPPSCSGTLELPKTFHFLNSSEQTANIASGVYTFIAQHIE